MKIFRNVNFKSFLQPALLLVLIFLPVFIFKYGVHTDGFFIITKKGNWLGDPEGAIMFMQGRPLGALLNSFIGWFINDVSQFTLLRIFVFLIKLGTGYLVYRICSRFMKDLWARLLAFFFLLLPSNIINVIWIANGVPESISLLCGVSSYFLLNRYTGRQLPYLIGAVVLFLIALLTYQPMATIVFAFILIKLLFSEESSWSLIRTRALQEICFFGAILFLYWLLIKCFILPFGKHILTLSATTYSMYQMDLVKNVSTKIPLVLEILKYSFIGTWDIVLHGNNHLEWIIIGLFSASILIFILIQRGFSVSFSLMSTLLQKLIFVCAVFLLSNAPSLMAINYLSVIGYRTFLSSSLMGLALLIFSLKLCTDFSKNKWSKLISKYATIFYLLSVILVAAWSIDQNVRNYLSEYSYINKLASRIDYHKTERIILIMNFPGQTVINYSLPLEMGLMTTTGEQVQYIFNKYSSKIHRYPNLIVQYFDWPIYRDDYTQIVDLSLEPNQNPKMPQRKEVLIHLEASEGQKLLAISDQSLAGPPIFSFTEIKGDGTKEPYWLLRPNVLEGSVDIDFMTVPEMPIGYKISAVGKDAGGSQSVPFAWKWEGSNDRKQWTNLSTQTWASTNASVQDSTFYFSKALFPFQHLRLTFYKHDPTDVLVIKDFSLLSFP